MPKTKGEEENMTLKTTRMTMKTIVEKEEEVKEGSQQEQQQKVEVSMAERMKVFEQQEQPQNNAFAGFEDLTSGEGGQNIPHDGTPTDFIATTLLAGGGGGGAGGGGVRGVPRGEARHRTQLR